MAGTSITYIDVADADERDEAIAGLLRRGFVVQHETASEVQLAKPKRLGGPEMMALLFGLLCFVIPAVVYFALWTAKPTPVVVIRLSGA